MYRVWSGRVTQYSSAFTAMMGLVCAGLHMGWASPALPKLLDGSAGFQITRDDSSWIVSMLNLGTLPGCLVARFLVDRIGRKMTMLLSAWPYCASWILIMMATSSWYLYAAQLMAGLSLGIGLVVTSMYCGEIAEKEIRGALTSTLNFGMNIGSLMSYSIGPYFDYQEVAYITVFFPLIFFAFCLAIPESPYYFLIKGDKTKARESLMKLRDCDNLAEVNKELDEIEINVKEDLEKRGGLEELFSGKMYRRAIIIIVGIRSLQQLCGNMAIISYMQIIFEATSISMESSLTTILYGVLQVISGIIATIATDKLGRKPLLYFSSIGHSIALTAIGTYFFLQDYLGYPEETMSKISWLPLASIMLFCVCYSVGIGSLGYVLLGEYFPTNVKSIAVSCGSIYGSSLAFLVSKLYLVVADEAGVYVAFWIFAGCCYCGLFFTHFVVPETKNKSFVEIQKKLNR